MGKRCRSAISQIGCRRLWSAWEYSIDLEVDIKLIKYKYDDGTVSVSEIFLDRRLVIRDIKVTQCQE